MKVTYNSKIKISKNDISLDLYRKLADKYTFTTTTYDGKILSRKAYKTSKEGIELPMNSSYFEKIIESFGEDLEIVDERALPKLEKEFKSNITLRDNQPEMLEKMKKADFNCLVTAKTGFGKTAMALYLGEILQTPILFIASQVNLVNNMLKDVIKFGINEDEVIRIDREWLDNPIIKPIMFASIQALSDEILEELYDKVGLIVADEIHLGLSGEGNTEILGKINPRYRVYLSATPNNMNFKGLSECLFSDNWLDVEENIDFDIDVHNLSLLVQRYIVDNYRSVKEYHKKKEIYFNEDFLKLMGKIGAYISLKKDRGLLIYVEDKFAQNFLVNELKEFGLKVGVLNSDSNKKHKLEVINGYDNGDFDIIIAGVTISAGISLYRLSLIINLNITLNENNLEQLIGRLKRKDDKICDKTKIFLQITMENISHKKWENDKRTLTKFPYIKFSNKKIIDISREITFSHIKEYLDKIL